MESITIHAQHVGWKYFPGYNKILQAFMSEMKARPISHYSQALKKAAVALLTKSNSCWSVFIVTAPASSDLTA